MAKFAYRSATAAGPEGGLSLELAKGKPCEEVASADELVIALESIKQAVEAGELDN